jgi:hydrogenase expression/formation protein HypC
MCLAIPGQIEALKKNPLGMKYADVVFGGIKKEICVDLVPDAEVGEYIIAHAGLAISKLDAQEAEEIFKLVRQLESQYNDKDS